VRALSQGCPFGVLGGRVGWPDDGGDIMERTENCIKEVKTHRCAMDTDLVFVSEGIDGDVVDYNKY
jgi:hypothetical protein